MEIAWAPIEVFAGTWPEARARCGILSNQDAPAFFQELRFRSDTFWRREIHVANYFRQLALDERVRKAVLDCHVAQGQAWGTAFMGGEVGRQREAVAHAARASLKALLPVRLKELWQEHMRS